MKRLMRFTLDVFGFLLVLILLEQIASSDQVRQHLGIPLSWGTANDTIATQKHFAQAEPPDIVIIGSSVAQSSIYPRQLQDTLQARTGETLTVINAAGNWFSADLTYDMLTAIMPRIHQPRMVVYPVFPLDFLPRDTSNREDRLLESSRLLRLYLDAPPLQPLLIESDLIQYATNTVEWLRGDYEPRPLNNYRGFFYQTYVADGVENYAGDAPQPVISGDSYAVQQFRKALEWGHEHGVFFVVIQTPLPQSYRESPNGQINQAVLDSLLRAYDAQFSNMVYLDLYDTQPFTLEGAFADPTHVNITGATEWTGRLAEALLRANILEQAAVGIVRLYGDNDLVVFNLESQRILQFFRLQDGAGSLLIQLDAAQWQNIPTNDQRVFDDLTADHQIILTRLGTNRYTVHLLDSTGTIITEAVLVVPSMAQ